MSTELQWRSFPVVPMGLTSLPAYTGGFKANGELVYRIEETPNGLFDVMSYDGKSFIAVFDSLEHAKQGMEERWMPERENVSTETETKVYLGRGRSARLFAGMIELLVEDGKEPLTRMMSRIVLRPEEFSRLQEWVQNDLEASGGRFERKRSNDTR